MLKTIGNALWARLWGSYKSTLLGMALVAADVIVTQLEGATLPNWAHAAVGIAATLLALYRGKVVAPPPAA